VENFRELGVHGWITSREAEVIEPVSVRLGQNMAHDVERKVLPTAMSAIEAVLAAQIAAVRQLDDDARHGW
jgi:hypothetical protein